MPPRQILSLDTLLSLRTRSAWDKILQHLDAIPRGSLIMDQALNQIATAVKTWPKTVHRPPLGTWGDRDPRLSVCRIVFETSLYNRYINAICFLCTCDPARPCAYSLRPKSCLRCGPNAGGADCKSLPDLRTRDNNPAVNLAVRYTGKAQSADGTHEKKIGVVGSADTAGSMILEWTNRTGILCRIAPETEVEIKMEKTGRPSEDQIKRSIAINARGGIHIFANTIPQAIMRLYEIKTAKEAMLGS